MANLAYLCFCYLLIALVCDSHDTLHPGIPLHDGKSISSSNGTFQMGFFSPDDSQQRFFGIWYNYETISPRTVVWVANRDSHLDSTSGAVRLSLDGNLQVLNATNGTAVWSSNSSIQEGNPVAQLLESGNLIVKDGSGKYIWQSFDYPTDTALPGMKIGMDLTTGSDRILKSWKTDNDPSTGNSSFLLDSHGFPQLMLFISNSTVRFRLGPWNGKSFSGVPMMENNPTFTYNFVLNQTEIYYVFNLINQSVYSRLVLGSDGILRRYTWKYETREWTTPLNTPLDNCISYGLCRGNGICNMGKNPACSCLDNFTPTNPVDWAASDWSSGCVRKTPLNCTDDGFIKYPGVKLPDTRNSWYNESMNLEECKERCSENCTCMAYSNINITDGSGCLLWFGDLMDTTDLIDHGQDIYIRMAASELVNLEASITLAPAPAPASIPLASTDNTRRKMMILLVSLALLAVILVSGVICALYMRKKRQRNQQKDMQASQEPTLEVHAGRSARRSQQMRGKKEDLQLPLFDRSTLLKATNYFSEDNKIGEGGFGPVYKGTLQGQDIAVKRLSKNSNQGLEEFKNEVILIAKLQHRNLVRLLGCCIEAEEKMLVYEYMPNNSLDTFIFDEIQRKSLDWSTRFHIINGVARGLLYLHQDSRLRVIHRDLKAGNILLDDGMDPKISDFGMARSFGGNEGEANTRRVVGTYGYMSPEYAVDGQFSVKSDVFSFGVLVLEIISGTKNRGFSHPDHHHNLIGHAWILHNEERALELVDKCMSTDSTQLLEISRSIHVGLLCVQTLPEDRPSMSNVVLMMLGRGGVLPKPKEPGFFVDRNLFHGSDGWSSSKPTDSSGNNEMSISSMMEPR